MAHGTPQRTLHTAITYTLEKNGHQFDLTLMPTVNGFTYFQYGAPEGWVDARGLVGPQPLAHSWTKNLDLIYVPGAKTEYLQFNLVAPPDGETMAAFADGFTAFEAAHPDAERLVIDLRHNPGGDNTVLRPLLISLIRSRLNHRGKLFVLLGPTTFSAAQNFTNRLELYTDAIFVGEPTGENVAFYGDPQGTTLPNSHLDVEMAHLWWQDEDPRDKRTATSPEIAISPGTFADYEAGRDAALDFCLHAPPPASFRSVMDAAAQKGEDAAWVAYQAYIADPVHRYATEEEKTVNTLGYAYLGQKDLTTALVLFRLNARAFPRSANAWDSLGEGSEDAHRTAEAVAAYRRSLELNSQNEHAREALLRLDAGQK